MKSLLKNKQVIYMMIALVFISLVIIGTILFSEKRNDEGQNDVAHKGDTTEASIEVKEDDVLFDNQLLNAEFKGVFSAATPDDQGVVDTEKSWIFFTNSDAEGTFEITNDGVRVTPTQISGKPNYSLQLIQSPVSLEGSTTYKVSIVAKADVPRKLTIKVGATGDKGWTAYGQKEVNLTTEFAQYDFDFTMRGEADPKARFELFLADDLSPVEIKQVSMIQTGVTEGTNTMEDLIKRTKTEKDEDGVENWELIWSDEFDAPALDMSKWTPEIGNGADKSIAGWGNNELQYYTDSPQNVFIEDGKLIIRAMKEQKSFTVKGQDYTTDYTSARLITEGKFSTAYGKIEARMKVPSGQGFWPAFWMLGDDIGTVGWPACGEIDILEFIGSAPTEVHGTVHGPVTGGPGIHQKVDLGIDMTEDFHTYAIEWDEDEVEFYVDDILYHVVNKDEVALEQGPEEWVFDHPHFLILNLAVGGTWPGAPSAETVFPSQLEVDYVRVYQDNHDGTIDGEEEIDSIYEKPEAVLGVETFANGDFSSGSEHWNSYFHFDAKGSFSVLDEQAQLNIENDGAEDYSVILEQGKFKIESDQSYILEFDAKSTVPRSLITLLDNANYSRPFSKQELLGTDLTHFKYEISGISDEITLKFLLGEHGAGITEPYQVIIDNVVFIKAD